MFTLHLEKTISTPEVIADEERGYLSFAGESFPENVQKFYGKLINWLYAYLKSDFKSFSFDCQLIYFNSSTSKLLMNMLNAMDEAAVGGDKKIMVNWICSSDNEIFIECGEEFGEDFQNLEFNIVIK